MWLVSALLPQRCAGCGVPGRELCEACLGRLVRVGPPGCERCGAPGPWPVRRCAECAGRRLGFATARAAIAYDHSSRRIVAAWKEHGRRDLTPVLADLVLASVPRPHVTALTFVPGDRERGLVRGHVPAESLARELGRRWAMPLHAVLARRDPDGRATSRRQAELALAARRVNVRGAFAAVRPVDGSVGLVDDVYTTGSTAAACSIALRRAGAARVDVVCLARAVR